MDKLELPYIKSEIKKRDPFSNKGDYGHALIIAGKKGSMGAAVIAAKACLRSGVGLLSVSVPGGERCILQTTVPEAMLVMREESPLAMNTFSAIGMGPGMGIDPASEALLIQVLASCQIPLVLDADALTILSKNIKLLEQVPAHTIITPHAGEFDRLFGYHTSNEERVQTAIQKANDYPIHIVLKGHHTAIVSAGEISYNTTGNTGLAKGGSGDALTGMITAFLAQGYAVPIAAKLGVFIHGMAADITLQTQSVETMMITDVIDHMANAFKKITR